MCVWLCGLRVSKKRDLRFPSIIEIIVYKVQSTGMTESHFPPVNDVLFCPWSCHLASHFFDMTAPAPVIMHRQGHLLLVLSLSLLLICIPVAVGWVVPTSSLLTQHSLRYLADSAFLPKARPLAMSQNEEEQRGEKPRLSVLGVCGGIGSGKSQACKILVSELGCVTHIGTNNEQRQLE